MSEVGLQGARIVAFVGQGVAAGVPLLPSYRSYTDIRQAGPAHTQRRPAALSGGERRGPCVPRSAPCATRGDGPLPC
jgi:hypothetical protein